MLFPAYLLYLAIFCLPIMIGAKDVAFPRLNLFSWYLYVTGVITWFLSLNLPEQGPPDTGWTFYAPYSFRTTGNMLPAVFGAFVLGFSSILTGLKLSGYNSQDACSGNDMAENAFIPLDPLCNRHGYSYLLLRLLELHCL